MSLFLKKMFTVFRGSGKKNNKEISKDLTPEISSPPSSIQLEKNDSDEEDISETINGLRKLFVGGLAYSTSAKELEVYFSRFGRVIDSVVVRHPETRKSRGFGFVTFIDPESATAALEFENHVLHGKIINLRPFNTREFHTKYNERKYENRVFLGGLPFNVKEEDAKQIFGIFGEVEDIKILLDKKTKKSKGYGFLQFKDKRAAEKCIAQSFIYLHGRRVLIRKAEPPDFSKINDNLSINNESDLNIKDDLEALKNFDVESPSLPAKNNDDALSVVSGERPPKFALNSKMLKFSEDNFSIEVPNFNKMNEKDKGQFSGNSFREVEKLLEDFLMKSSEQSIAFGGDLIEFSDKSESDSDDGKGTTDDDSSIENVLQELNTQFPAVLMDESSSKKVPNHQISELIVSEKSSVPFKIKDEKGALMCSLCQWIPSNKSCESFLAHCKTTAHRRKLRERFPSEESQEDKTETSANKDSKQTQEIYSKSNAYPLFLNNTQLSFSVERDENQKNQKYRKKEPSIIRQKKQSQPSQSQTKQQRQASQQQPQISTTQSAKLKKSMARETKNNKENTRTAKKNIKPIAREIKALEISAIFKGLACIEPISEYEIICKMCNKTIPISLEFNALLKNIMCHLQSKRHLKELSETKDLLSKSIENKDVNGQKIQQDKCSKQKRIL